jgi:DNA-binding NarL/FixJ family response regulator
VLIADAHHNMLKALRGLLADRFDAVVTVSDEVALVREATLREPELIVVDLSLPVAGADNILRRLKAVRPGGAAKIIALSIHDEAEAACESLAAGATGFVLKRSAATDLVPAVEDVLLGRIYVSPDVQGDRPAAALR